MIAMERRLQREREFHDKAFSEGTRERADKFYSVVQSSRRAYADILLENCQGKRILEYGCGPGSDAFRLAENGANVIGIDISVVAIRQAGDQAAQSPARERLDFRVMNAEELEFEDDYFDVICGTGILHHLDLTSALAELARVLRREGKAVFIEPLGHNPLINLYRRLTPGMRTKDEHPLLRRDLLSFGQSFGKVRIRYFHLLALCAVPFRFTARFETVLEVFEAIDQKLFSIPFIRNQAWQVVIELSEPYKASH